MMPGRNRHAAEWLRNGVVVVTGASTGLGRALARGFAARGLAVAGIARNVEGLRETGAAIADPDRFRAIRADVADPAALRAALAQVESDLGPVAVLMNNAVIYERGDFLSDPAERVLHHIAVNMGGMVNAAAAALPGMIMRGRGRIVNVGSFAGEAPVPGSLGLSVSKAGARAFSLALAAELSGRLPGITVSEWMPGVLATRSGDPAGIAPEIAARWGVCLALDPAPELHGAVFVRDRQMLPRKGWRGRVKDALLLRRPPRPRRLCIDPPPCPAERRT